MQVHPVPVQIETDWHQLELSLSQYINCRICTREGTAVIYFKRFRQMYMTPGRSVATLLFAVAH